MRLSLKNIIFIAFLVSVTLSVIFVIATLHYSRELAEAKQALPLTPAQTTKTNTNTVDDACAFDREIGEIICNREQLNDVYEQQLETDPKFVTFTDASKNVSFEYPSAIAEVESIKNANETRYAVYPKKPGAVASSFWSGIQIYMKTCNSDCLSNVKEYITKKYKLTKDDKIEVSNQQVSLFGKNWILARINFTSGNVVNVYLSQVNKRLVVVSDDTEYISANISKAFNHVIETLQF